MNPDQLRHLAAKMANSLGIPLYIHDGQIWQTPPGERVDPPPSAQSSPSHGRFEMFKLEQSS